MILTMTTLALFGSDLLSANIENSNGCPASWKIIQSLNLIKDRQEIIVYENDFSFANTTLENNTGSFITHAFMLKKYLNKGVETGIITNLAVSSYLHEYTTEFIEQKFGYPICAYTIGYGRSVFGRNQPGEAVLILRK